MEELLIGRADSAAAAELLTSVMPTNSLTQLEERKRLSEKSNLMKFVEIVILRKGARLNFTDAKTWPLFRQATAVGYSVEILYPSRAFFSSSAVLRNDKKNARRTVRL